MTVTLKPPTATPRVVRAKLELWAVMQTPNKLATSKKRTCGLITEAL